MKLEDQVCSLDLARKLKELGVKQESLFCWADGRLVDKHELMFQKQFESIFELISAFTVAELGEILVKHGQWKFDETFYDKIGWRIFNISLGYFTTEKTEADARSKMLVWLIENGKVKP